jgi:hypothetical protein
MLENIPRFVSSVASQGQVQAEACARKYLPRVVSGISVISIGLRTGKSLFQAGDYLPGQAEVCLWDCGHAKQSRSMC